MRNIMIHDNTTSDICNHAYVYILYIYIYCYY